MVGTHLLVSALIIPHGAVGPVLLRLRRGDYTLLYAQPLLEELVDVLNRPRIRGKYHWTSEDIQTVVGLILLRGGAVPPGRPITACRDPKGNQLLEAAVAGKADVIVSGDEDLLVLNPFAGIPVLPPAGFLRLLDAGVA